MRLFSLKSIIVISALMLMVLMSCGGEGSGGGVGTHAPVLSGLYISPNSANQYTGSGTTQVNFSFDFTDAAGDLASITITVYDDKGAVLASDTDTITGGSGITAGYIDGYFNADTHVTGNYKVAFSVTDSQGKKSNVVDATFTVIPVALLLSVEVTPANPTILKQGSQQFTATANYDDGTKLNVTTMSYWTSSDTAVATIDGTGRAAGKAGGFTTITALYSGVSGSTTLTVVADFGPAVKYPGTSWLFLGNTAIGDLNGDSRNDVAVIEGYNSRNRIALYYQNAGHTLDAQQVITTDLDLRGVAIADVNNDGLLELIVAGNATSGTLPLGRVYVYTQDPTTHALGSPQQYTLSTNSVTGLAVADLNNDGLLDIVVSGEGSIGTAVVSFLFQGSAGTLSSEVTYTTVSVYGGGELHVADMNNDGMNDIVLQSGAKQLAVIKQVSSGQFSTSPDYYTVQTSYWPHFRSFALGDLNGDGRTDIAAVDPGNDSYLNIFLQNDSGQLTGPTARVISYLGQDEIHIADVNNDGRNDIIMITNGRIVEVMYQTADHAFPDLISYYIPTSSSGGTPIHQAVSIGDVTGDGLADIVTTWFEELYVLPHAQ